MYVNIFEYKMRADADMSAYQELAVEMYGAVSANPQYEFLGLQTFATSPTEGVVVERFGSLEGARRWASDPHHREVQRRGQREFYAWYRGFGCVVDHEYHHPEPVEETS